MISRRRRIYASHGVRKYWVINAATPITTVHAQPSGAAYAIVREVAPSGLMSPMLAPALAVSLAVLDLE
jgi:Uma2 family endonuclease